MALYDGFFDAEYNAEADSYDREYESGDFTGYLAQVIGSGVCVYNNEDSFKVRMGDGAAIISPGYLFIQGYYLKNDADHSLTLPGTGTYAIAAHLSLGKRMIELEAVSVSSSYPDSLVLAIVNGTANTADDTRYNTDICGVIDSAGELSKKVEYAINYIDNEIEGKLASVQAEIDAQAEKMDAKIAQAQAIVDRIVPPPVGTIKFSASQNVGSDWLRCDGSYINESDYPELVEALGKLTPGVDDVTEMLQAATSEQMSNVDIQGGTVWVYLAESKKLVGMTGTTKKEIDVTGVESLEISPSIDIVLSVVDGAVYLAQNNAGNSRYILLECANFTGTESSIAMTSLAVNATGLSAYCVPSVTKVGTKVHVAYGAATPYVNISTVIAQNGTINYVMFTPGGFASAEYKTAIYRPTSVYSSSTSKYITGYADEYLNSFALFGFQKKNGNEMVYVLTEKEGSRSTPQTITRYSSCGSVSQMLFRSEQKSTIKSFPTFNKNTLPVCANNECLINVEIVSRNLVITYLNYNIDPEIKQKTVEAVSIPSRAKLFKDSVVYANAQGLWFVFTGTGLLFSEGLEEGNWGYLDTQSLIGYIGTYGCLNYESATNSLCISGMSSDGTPKVARLKLPDLYNLANDGAFLPNIASDGVPAYIKATDEGGDTPVDNTLKVTVLEPTTADKSRLAEVLFNDLVIPVGEFTRTVSETFTVGIRKVDSIIGGTYSYVYSLYVNGGVAATIPGNNSSGTTKTVTLYKSDYKSGITLQYRVTRA